MSDKIFFIDEYFKQWEYHLKKASELLENDRYQLEGMLVLSCLLGAFASSRFPNLKDGEAYVKIIQEYSGKRKFFDKIDLLFFYQWKRSKLQNNGSYKGLKQYDEIIEALKQCYGTEEKIKIKTRYISQEDIIEKIKIAAIPFFDENNLRIKLPLFSLAEILYRYLRCDAVHNYDFPLLNRGIDGNGNLIYEHNHAITADILLETTKNVLSSLWEECRSKQKWPHEI